MNDLTDEQVAHLQDVLVEHGSMFGASAGACTGASSMIQRATSAATAVQQLHDAHDAPDLLGRTVERQRRQQ